MSANPGSDDDDGTGGIDRRTFLKSSAAVVGVASIGGAGAIEEASPQPDASGQGTWAASGSCWDCHMLCGQRVKIRDGKAVELEGVDGHPRGSAGSGRQGTLCSKGNAQIEKAYDPDRLRQPYVRKNGTLQRVSWEEAWQAAADKLDQFAKQHGPEKLLVPHSYGSTGIWKPLLSNLYGTPNVFGHKTICHGPWSDTWSWMGGVGRPFPDHKHSEYIINWGRNEMEAFIGQWEPKGILDAKRNNDATLVTIDPRYTQTAAHSDEWLPIEPRSDGALALAMGHVIVENELYDTSFVENYTYGFDEYRSAVADKTPEWAAEITGIDASTIREVATGFAEAAPHCYIHIWSGITQSSNGQKAAQNIHCLNGLVGNLDRPGGLRYWKAPVGLDDPYETRNVTFPNHHEGKPKAMADYTEYPFHHVRDLAFSLVPKAVDRGDIAGIFNYWANRWKGTDTKAWITAIEDMDLVIAIDAYWNGLTKRADVVFPESSQLEKPMLGAGGPGAYSTTGWITGSKAAIDPQWNTKPGYEIVKGLAEAMGYGEYFPWSSKAEKIDDALAGAGLDLDELDKKNFVLRGSYGYESWKKEGFDTESGKFQFVLDNVEPYVKAAKQAGISTKPEYVKPGTFGHVTDETHPLLFTDTFVEQLSRGSDQSLDHSLEQLKERWGLDEVDYEGNFLLINPADADPRGIAKGDMVTVQSENGSMSLMANVTQGIRPGYVTTTFGFGKYSIAPNEAGGNSMMLHNAEMMEPITGMVDRRIPVEVHSGGGN